jgi:uncharacterized C2H2 Zn-finger protein
MGWSNFPENWEKDVPQIEITDIDRVPTELIIGTKYHCTWAFSKGMVWILKGISQNNQAILETPRTKKIIHTHVHNLRHINKNALLQAKVRIKKENRLKELKDKELDTLT